MSLVNDLEQLRELPSPPMPSLWPQTWGWALVLTLLLIMVAVALLRWRLHWRTNAYRRAALAELDVLEARWRRNPVNPAPLRDLPGLLKRTVLNGPGVPSPEVARMTGPIWQRELQRMADIPLSETFAECLADLAYASDETLGRLDAAALIAECRQWLETHHDPV
ncbi:DUF4381 domain-containing protein [Marinobacter sp. F4206]|uniref:DUF4381 domain-containing protein n=1 Tax=Marinobacter sp. F4206 TaxID=2861777 RepID=UPI001C5FD29F|nr:DUF4381 domain-containing protein [Marinobacter sp. F4206]MBW4935391.1 DUF4381 domain-containing protein [Marinobacter sp. F4206]